MTICFSSNLKNKNKNNKRIIKDINISFLFTFECINSDWLIIGICGTRKYKLFQCLFKALTIRNIHKASNEASVTVTVSFGRHVFKKGVRGELIIGVEPSAQNSAFLRIILEFVFLPLFRDELAVLPLPVIHNDSSSKGL